MSLSVHLQFDHRSYSRNYNGLMRTKNQTCHIQRCFICSKTTRVQVHACDAIVLYIQWLNRFPYFVFKQEDWALCRVFYKSRATIAKPLTESRSYNVGIATTSSLPSLIDNYNISFDQPGSVQNLEGYEQVPCFSNNPSQPSLSMNVPMSSVMAADQEQHMGKSIKDVLVVSQFSRFEGNVKREAPQSKISQDGFDYLAESGFTQMWNSFN
jgi:hypothetical protein